MDTNLEGEIVVVTGGAKRLGRAIALECAASGAAVAITYRGSLDDAETCLAEMRALNSSSAFAAYQVEVSDGEAIARLLRDIKRDFGGVTALVNNAGLFRRTPFAEMTESDFDMHVATNLKGPYLASKVFGDHFRQLGRGAIVNIGDIHALRPLANYIPYCISKAGVVMLTEALAKALAPSVRVNCICPGTILAPSEDQGGEDEAGTISRIPMGRLGTPEEIARTVAFLIGGPSFITGAILPVDGGQRLR